MEKSKLEVIVDIAKRADKMGLLAFDRISLIMDLEYVTEEFNLLLEEFLKTDDFNFAHDICGIQRHFNRTTKRTGDCFVPRFASKTN